MAETDQLLRTFASLLWLARIEAQAPARDEPVLDLAALVADAVELYTPSAGERAIRLQRAPAAGQVHGDRDQLFQMLVNLLDNALKYAPARQRGRRVAGRRRRQGALLQIDDRRPGHSRRPNANACSTASSDWSRTAARPAAAWA